MTENEVNTEALQNKKVIDPAILFDSCYVSWNHDTTSNTLYVRFILVDEEYDDEICSRELK